MADTSRHTCETFLRGPDVERRAAELISQAHEVRVAVAYWGSGSFKWFERFDAESLASKDVVIVCDLMSGACNPDEIERLQKTLGKPGVRTRDRLHAKVWLTDRGAIVGSSNVSANGLGFEGDELKLAEIPDVDPAHIDELIHDWNSAPPDIFIFQTGVGTRALFAATDSLGLTDVLLRRLDAAQVVVRGPKPTVVLHSRKVRIDGAASDPFTTREVLAEMHDRPRQPIESRDRDGRGHRRRRADVG
jgi:hypothetical protein